MDQAIKITKFEINKNNPKVYLIVIKLEVNPHSHYWESCLDYSTNGINPLLTHDGQGTFVFDETIDVCTATLGILANLQQLQKGNNFGSTTIDCNILRCLKALDLFWN